MSWSAASGPVLACALLGCEWSSELPSDPAAWSPPRSSESEIDATDIAEDSSTIDPACRSGVQPPLDPMLQTSTATSVSHLPGVTCLEGCHAEGGEARTPFAAAGTIYRSQTSREPVATGGSVHGIGGMTLTVDRCGNFYIVRGALTDREIESTQPFVENPTVHRMEKLLRRQGDSTRENVGSCNQVDCHDFSTKLKWGVYY